uniref:Uncharacterized protein n=1 Tax=Tanacetum cinerariifolium TaxID=118510 RepID=A0A699HUY0_TANCI|nr:hypothetical protein [Tanacetum cinerariifolium]
MTTPNVTSSTDSKMHNNIMAAGSRDRPPMLATGRYPQWHSWFLRYIDTRPNGEALRKCILSGPYKPTTVLVQPVEGTDDSLAIPEHTTVETPMNMSPENKAHFEAKKEAIHLILTGIRDEIYSTVDACQTAQEMWEAIERFYKLMNEMIRNNLTVTTMQVNVQFLQQLQPEWSRLAMNANPLALVATAQANKDLYYQTSRSYKSHVPLVKENQEKDKIKSKPDKNGKRGEAERKCSSCEALYTRNCSCSKRSVEDKILIPKLPENYARCARCGHPVNGPYCQGCALLREKLEEDLITYLKYFQDTSESSDDSTNVVNAPREPFVVKKDHGVNPPQIDKCCCECGEALDGIYYQRCICKSYGKEQAANARYWKIFACCDDDDDYDSAITLVLSTEETENSLSMGDEHLDTIPATKSDEVIKSSVEDLVPILSEFEGIPDSMCDVHLDNNHTPLKAKDYFEIVINSNDDNSSSDDDSLYKENIEYVEASPHDSELVSLEAAEIIIPEEEEIEDDNLREKLLNINLLIANIEALKDNPTPSSDCKTKSSSTSPKSFLEETNTFHNSLPEFKNFYFDLGEISSGSTTTHSDISLSEYDSFIFDFTHEEFVDELAHIISPPEYDCFYFCNLPDPGELMYVLNSRIHENLSTTSVNLPVEDDYSPLLTYVVWIFLAYLTYFVIPLYLHSFGNEDTIFDPGITINRFCSLKPGLSHRCGAFKKFNTHRCHLNEWPMIINGKNTPILDVLLFHFYPP